MKIKTNTPSKQKPDVMRLIAENIVKYRYVIFVLFIVACVYCALSIGKVKTSSDLTFFLPAETETRRGIDVMAEEFDSFVTASIMVSNISYEKASELAEEMRSFEHITDVGFDDSSSHYVNSSALFSVSFDSGEMDDGVVADMDKIRELLTGYDTYINTEVGIDFVATVLSEMAGVMIIAFVVIIGVLLFTSRSYFEVVIFMIVFAVAALLNMGTNFWLGEISTITNSIAVIMQLALAIDYAIIFSHRYQDEVALHESEKEALTEALSKAIIEISASSLTTISGLVALTLMQFGLGPDLGTVLAKGILCSLITVFLLMPGLIMLFPKALKRTRHRSHVPNVEGWGRFLMKTKLGFALIFLLAVPAAIWLSGKAEYAFDDTGITELVYSESRAATRKIYDTFDHDTMIALIVPNGDYEAEKAVLREIKSFDEIRTVTGLAAIEIERGHVLTDMYTPRMFSLLLNIDYETAALLFQAYGAEHQQFQAIFGNTEEYAVPLVDMFMYLFEKIDQGIVNLDGETMDTVNDLRGDLERGVAQLSGTEHDRMIFTAAVPVESAESLALVDRIRAVGERYYGEGNALVIGNITSSRDLADSFNSDSTLISILTIVFIYLILLFTFKSFAGAAILVFVIQGSIWINFSCSYIMGTVSSFVTQMIVSAIQMGATIDYAIVIMSHYQTLKKEHEKHIAMTKAVNESFPTIMTSGSILTLAGLLIAYRVSDVYIGHIGLAVGRGALISVILVLTVLPQIIVLLDRVIDKTTFSLNIKIKEEEP